MAFLWGLGYLAVFGPLSMLDMIGRAIDSLR